jgi:hypothetical protein
MGSKSLGLLAFVLLLVISACVPGKPASVISSPPSGSQYNEGDQVAVQSTSADAAGITRVELTIDGAVVRSDTPPSPQTNFSIIQTWKATAGPHTIIVRAYNAAGVSSDPAAIAISVGAAAAATSTIPPTVATGSLTGQVTFTGISSQPAPNVKVALVDAPAISTTTGNDGRYALSNIPAGAHVVSASTNTGSSNPVNVNIPAGGSTTADLSILAAQPTSPPATAPAAGACTNNVAFVADVTVPDGTSWAPGQAFNKIWRVKNTGTCAWTTAYDFAFAGGEAMATTTAIAVPDTAPGATADLLVAMVAPATPGPHAGQWKLRNVGDAFFGGAMTIKINVIDTSAPPPVVPPPATGCTGTPNIASFTASATTINAGQSTTLNWGAVTGADSVEIDNGIGGVPAPGSATVSPGANTTYTMIARCGSNTKTAQVTINVQVLAPPVQAFPDLYVSEFSLDPSTPHRTQVTHVRIGIYNQGNAASGAFKVEWWAGSNYASGAAKTWNIASMAAHGGQILTYDAPADTWKSAYGSITTRVKVDVDGNVTESNEDNNIFDKNISVLSP